MFRLYVYEGEKNLKLCYCKIRTSSFLNHMNYKIILILRNIILMGSVNYLDSKCIYMCTTDKIFYKRIIIIKIYLLNINRFMMNLLSTETPYH